MKRSRFDPSRAAGAPRGESSDASGAAGSLFAGDGAVPPPAALTGAAPAHAASSAISVSELASRIEGALAKGFPDRVRVVGEISNLRKQTHLYFNLKDPDGGDDSKHGAVISCVMFAKDASGVRFTPADGAKVVITGRIAFFAKQGRTQLYVEAMEPMGLGALEQRFRALSEELKKLGYFEPERKRALPVFPRRVAVVTSRTGAALQDVLSTMKRRCAAVDVAVVDVRVQGDGAAPSIVRALDWLSREHERLGVDAVIVTRGGGSIEDLWAFNERAVAEAIVRSSVPVVAAIGHETDVTIAELVADARCATPTQAAMVLTPDRAALGEELLHRRARLVHSMLRRFERERMRLSVVEAQPLYADPAAMVREARGVVESWGAAVSAAWQEAVSARRLVLERLSSRLAARSPRAVHEVRRITLANWDDRLRRAWRVAADRRRSDVEGIERALTLAGPASVLARGYSVTRTADGSVVRSVEQVAAGDEVRTVVMDGEFGAVVKEHGERRGPVKPERRKTAKREDGEQMGLF